MEKTTIIDSPITNYKKGLDLQRELFKTAKVNDDISVMYNSIDNIKIEIKSKAILSGFSSKVKYIEKRLNWIRTLKSRHTVRTKSGLKCRLPKNWRELTLKYLNECYEELMSVLTELRLL